MKFLSLSLDSSSVTLQSPEYSLTLAHRKQNMGAGSLSSPRNKRRQHRLNEDQEDGVSHHEPVLRPADNITVWMFFLSFFRQAKMTSCGVSVSGSGYKEKQDLNTK